MQREIERRFLVTGDAWRKDVVSREELFQGYLHVGDEKAIRVRLASAGATLTIKAAISDVVRHEFEYAIPPTILRKFSGYQRFSREGSIVPQTRSSFWRALSILIRAGRGVSNQGMGA